MQEKPAEEPAHLAERRRVIAAVRECWLKEERTVPVLRRPTAELGRCEDRAGTAFAVVTHMSDAFCIRPAFAMKFTRWHAIGGDLSDEESEERFEGFITCPVADGRTRPCEIGR